MQKRVKIKAAAVLAIILCISGVGTGCKHIDSLYESLFGTKVLEGYILYESEEDKYKIQYPEGWAHIYSGMTEDEIAKEIEAHIGGEDSTTVAYGTNSGIQSIWYDFTSMTDTFVPNMDLAVSRQVLITQKSLEERNNMELFQRQMDIYYPASYSGFKAVQQPEITEIGKNMFVTMIYSIAVGRLDLTIYEAISADKGYMFTFRFTNFTDDFWEMMDTYNTTLSTIEFTRGR